jgi:hypothetical protein
MTTLHLSPPTITAETVDHQAAGAAVRQRRIARGISLRSFARVMEISPSYLSDLERGRRNWTKNLWVGAMLKLPEMNQDNNNNNNNNN